MSRRFGAGGTDQRRPAEPGCDFAHGHERRRQRRNTAAR